MRKLFFILLSMATLGCFAQKGLSVEPLSLSPGETGQLVINLTQDEDEFCAFQFDITLPEGVEVVSVTDEESNTSNKWTLNTNRIHYTNGADTPHEIKSYNKSGAIRFMVFSLSGTKVRFSGTSGAIMYINVKAADDLTLGEQNVTVKNAQLTLTNDLTRTFVQEDFTYTFTGKEKEEDYLLGDVNNDGVVDNADFIATLRYTIGQVPTIFNEKAADVNQDEVIDNADAIKILRMSINN